MEGRWFKFRIRGGVDADIDRLLKELPEGAASEFIRQAIREKGRLGVTLPDLKRELEKLRKQLNLETPK